MKTVRPLTIFCSVLFLIAGCDSAYELCVKHNKMADDYWSVLKTRIEDKVGRQTQLEPAVSFGPIQLGVPPGSVWSSGEVVVDDDMLYGKIETSDELTAIFFRQERSTAQAVEFLQLGYPEDYILIDNERFSSLHYLPLKTIANELFPMGVSETQLMIDAVVMGPGSYSCDTEYALAERRAVALANSQPYAHRTITLIDSEVGYWEVDGEPTGSSYHDRVNIHAIENDSVFVVGLRTSSPDIDILEWAASIAPLGQSETESMHDMASRLSE